MFLVDSHCHLDMLDQALDGNSLNDIITRAQANGVKHILNVCVSIKDFSQVLNTANAYPFVSASLGLHPNEQAEEVDLTTLLKLGKHPKVVAIGETGLDYFRTTGPLEWQQERFRTHIEAAKILHKPLIVHTRAAREDTIRILQETKADEVGGVMHCFTEDWDMAKKALALNFYISFSGIVTFKNAADIQALAKRVPLDRLLIETDSPYLAPNPYRGKSNEPSFVRYTAAYLADLRNESLDTLAAQTTHNFFELFKGAVRSHV